MKRIHLLFISALSLVACKRPPPLTVEPDSGALTSTKEAPPVVSSAAPTGPAAGDVAVEDRKRVVATLLSGAYRVNELPEDATDPGRSFDRGLRKRLTEVEVPRGPRADVHIGGATATVPIENVDRVVAGMRARMRQCHQQGIDAHGPAAGKLVIRFVVGEGGEVTSATASANTNVPETTATCVASVVRRAQFSAGKGPSTVTVPIAFTTTP